jgi:hypothetical protein
MPDSGSIPPVSIAHWALAKIFVGITGAGISLKQTKGFNCWLFVLLLHFAMLFVCWERA